MFVNVDNIEFQPWSLRRGYEKSMRDVFCLSFNEFKIIESMLSQASDKHNVQQGIFKILEMSDDGHKLRIFKWLDYLLENSFLRSKLYNELLDTVIWALQGRLFLFNQTQYQFDSCKYYLDIIFKADVNFMHLQKCREAFLCICILAERPDLQIRSFIKGLNLLENVFEPRGVQFFDHLFNDNSRPIFFKEHFTNSSYDHLQLLISILEGQSPRKLLAPRFLVSKKENALLHGFGLDLTSFHSEPVERHVIAVKLLKEAPDSVLLLQALLDTSQRFHNDLAGFANDLDFWKSAFRLIARGESQLMGYTDVRCLVDYIEYQRYRQDDVKDYSLKGRTLNSILNAVEEWHEGATFFHTQKDLHQTWKPLGFPDFETKSATSVFRISEITSGKRLLKESKELKHCVFGYLGTCYTGKTNIFSLTEEKSVAGKTIVKSKVTMQVTNRRLVQAFGKANSIPPEGLMIMIAYWCDKNGIEK